mmetsp:Transcript_104134/g.201743  ORF Transcript_104134/g.201743 Transcript_104134/m.201743 type:complete len:232 (+) Transcript_104134:181-876(+)
MSPCGRCSQHLHLHFATDTAKGLQRLLQIQWETSMRKDRVVCTLQHCSRLSWNWNLRPACLARPAFFGPPHCRQSPLDWIAQHRKPDRDHCKGHPTSLAPSWKKAMAARQRQDRPEGSFARSSSCFARCLQALNPVPSCRHPVPLADRQLGQSVPHHPCLLLQLLWLSLMLRLVPLRRPLAHWASFAQPSLLLYHSLQVLLLLVHVGGEMSPDPPLKTVPATTGTVLGSRG